MCNSKKTGACCDMKKWCSPNLALLILRVSLGLIFLAHGLQKLNNMEGTVAFFASFSIPAFLAYLVAWVEFLSGVALIIGVGTWFAGMAIAFIMVFAIVLVKSKTGNILSAEVDFMAFAAALTIAFIGPGRFTLMKCGCKKCADKCEDVCGDKCGDKCCTGEKCECGDCGTCNKSEGCSHESGCTCGDCGTCK